MAHEFYQVMAGSAGPSIRLWKQLALWSIEYSCLSEAEIAEGTRLYHSEYESFLKSVVSKPPKLRSNKKRSTRTSNSR